MIIPIDQQTTIVTDISQKMNYSNSNLLYFHIILKAVNEDFSDVQRLIFERRIECYLKTFDCRVETVSITRGKFHLLVGLERSCYVTDFVQEIKIVSKLFARRFLRAGNFFWREEYEVSSVGLSQIKNINKNLRRGKPHFTENSEALWPPLSTGKTC